MNRSWAGPAVTGLIVLGVAAILVTNFQPGRDPLVKARASVPLKLESLNPVPPRVLGPNLVENLIDDPFRKNHLQVSAVWLAGASMEGMNLSADVIHLEADVKATEGNPNGFAKDEFVPYLKIAYILADASDGTRVDSGVMTPMIASDGLHYGASLAMPRPGHYRLTYQIEPPSAGGLGRHVGVGGVAPWWSPFDATFDWTVEASTAPALAGVR